MLKNYYVTTNYISYRDGVGVSRDCIDCYGGELGNGFGLGCGYRHGNGYGDGESLDYGDGNGDGYVEPSSPDIEPNCLGAIGISIRALMINTLARMQCSSKS